jgi:hypothetical protein
VRLRNGWKEVDEVNRVGAETDHVPQRRRTGCHGAQYSEGVQRVRGSEGKDEERTGGP